MKSNSDRRTYALKINFQCSAQSGFRLTEKIDRKYQFMANYSVHVSTVKRSVGQNAIASAAYNSRSELSLNITDKETNITVQLSWDYSKKAGLAHSEIHAPDHAPEWVYDRETLWNKAEKAENRCDSVQQIQI